MKLLNKISGCKLPSEVEIGQFKNLVGVDIPNDLIEFLRLQNVKDSEETYLFINGKEYFIADFYPLSKEYSLSIDDVFEELNHYFGNKYLAFANDPGGWQFVISINQSDYGSVYFCRMDTELNDSLSFLSESFSSFINQLNIYTSAVHQYLKEIENLNSTLNEIAKDIINLYNRSSDPTINTLINEYHKVLKHGKSTIKLSESYISNFETTHKVNIPENIRLLLLAVGEHPLCHFFLNPNNKTTLFEPSYIIEGEFFKNLISHGIDIIDIEEFKEDYTTYFNVKSRTFKSEKWQGIYLQTRVNYRADIFCDSSYWPGISNPIEWERFW